MLHVHDSTGKYVASINKQSRGSEFYNAAEPWLLLYHSGRIERFATLAEARDEARKTWGAKARFEKHDPMRKSNPVRKPAAKKPAAKRAYVNRPSQATKKPPTQRLKARRAANVRGSGMFPNPAPKKRGLVRAVSRSMWGPGRPGEFEVYTAPGAAHSDPSQQRLGELLARFKSKSLAMDFAQAYANAKNKRVIVTGS